MDSYEYSTVLKDDLLVPKGYGKRHTQAILTFICILTTTCVKGCISVAILAMTDKTLQGDDTQVFDWDKPTQGLIMSAFFWGDMIMQIPAGYLVCKYGGKTSLTVATIATGLSSFLTPVASKFAGWQGACASRVVMGITQAFMFPSIHTLLGKWAPISERNRVGIMVYSGVNIGIIAGTPIAAFISTSSLGWPWIFYFFGSVCVLHGIVYACVGANCPAELKSISKIERDFIEASLGEEKYDGNKKVPWKKIMKSRPVSALIISQCFLYSVYTVLMCEIPTFFKIGLNVDLESSGILSSLPYVASFFSGIFSSCLADYLLNKSIFSLTVIRKLFNSIGSVIPALCLVGLMYVPADYKAVAVTLMVVILLGDNFTGAGIMLNHIDLSPNFAGIIVSWSITISDIGNLLGPIVSGYILTDPSDISRWRILFLLIASIYTIGNLVFVVFGSAEKQPWDDYNVTPTVVTVPSDLIQELRLLKHNAFMKRGTKDSQ